MAITLRYTTTDTTGKTSELSYQEMNNNLKSYFYSSSLNGNTLNLFYLTSSLSQSIDLSAFSGTDTNLYNTDGALTTNRTVVLDGSDLVFDLSAGGDLILDTLSSATQNNILAYDSSTGTVTRMSTGSMNYYSSASVNLNTLTLHRGNGGTSVITIDTGSGGGAATTPGGSNTQVQFNQNGSFGGDANFTWNSGSQYLTLKGIISGPSLRLVNSIPINSAGVTLGYISAYQDTLASADIGGFKILADGTFSNNDVPTRLELLTTPDGTETPTVKLTVKNDGELIASQYGSGTFTGTAAYNLSVDASGNIIETDVAGPNISQPSAVTHTFNGDVGNSADYSWVVELGSGTSAPNSGSIRMGVNSPGNKDITTVTSISFHRTSANNTVTSAVLDYLCNRPTSGGTGTIAFRTTGGSIVADTIKIKSVDNSNDSYVIVYVDPSSSSGLISGGTGTTYYIDFQSDALITLQDQRYNRLVLNNLASSSPKVVLIPPATANVGDYYLVEVSAGSSNDGAIGLEYGTYITGATTTYNIARTAARYLAGTNTVTAISLDYSTYGAAAILHFRVHKVAGAAASFALIGADKVLS